jgi:PadR family transcriptional regulator PadR
MISSDVLRGWGDTIILAILLKGDSYGYSMSKSISECSGGRYMMKETTLYSAINRMERNGLISSYAGQQTHGKPRTYYRITAAGRDYYEQKCEEWRLTKEVLSAFIEEIT